MKKRLCYFKKMTFCEEYHQVCKDLSNLLGTDNETYVLGGEGILALEAACATLTEPGIRCWLLIMVFLEEDLLIL